MTSWPWWRAWRPTALIRASIAWHAASFGAALVWPAAWPVLLLGVVLNHGVLAAVGCWPRSRALGANLIRLPHCAELRREVALTFDDGPDPAVTPLVLDMLDRAGVHASFFCIGRRAAEHPDLVREILRRGHSVENHTQRHSNLFACRGIAGLQREIGSAQASLRSLGATPRFFRPPMGIRNPFLDPALAGSGLAAVSWTRRGYDAVRCDPVRSLSLLTRGLAAGDILLLHDGNSARTVQGVPMVIALLPPLLDALAARDLRAVSLTEAMELTQLSEAAGLPASAPVVPLPTPVACASR